MSINQAAIHYNLPYSSLYGRFKRGKYDVVANTSGVALLNTSGNTTGSIEIIEHSQENSVRSQSQYAAEKLKSKRKCSQPTLNSICNSQEIKTTPILRIFC